MTEIKSNKSCITMPISEVYAYLSVPANYEVLMPSTVRSFIATDDSATLDIQGLGSVVLAITERNEPTNIVMLPQNKVPFKFDLQWHLKSLSENETEVQAVINAELNFMMKMMAEKLLTDFLNVQVHKLSGHLK
ncbi:MAG: hypothetical protein COA58_01920 [Bacteroidetes bacterium]|nr:MAG: hypothetical protein COA58_01920 [Bacteroidota bacterium]